MLPVSPSVSLLDIVHIYFFTWATLFEGQLHPSTAQYSSGSW